MTVPYQHQIEANKFIQDKPFFALFMEQGTGKSKVILDRTAELCTQGKIDCLVVISPNSVKDQWVEEQLPTHYPYQETYTGHIWEGMSTQRENLHYFKALEIKDKLFVFSINIDAFQFDNILLFVKNILELRKCFVVVDESTRIKNGRRKPSKGKRGGAKRTNAILDLFEKVQYKAILTGTPTPQGPFDLWSQFEFLKKNFLGMDYFFFTHHYGIMIKKSNPQGRQYTQPIDEVGFKIVKNAISKYPEWNSRTVEELSIKFNMSTKDIIEIKKMEVYSPYKNLQELYDKIAEITFFVKKADCLDLPDKVYEHLYCEMGKEQKRVYKELKDKLYSEYAGKEISVITKCVLATRLAMVTGGLFPYQDLNFRVVDGEPEEADTTYKYKPIEDNGKIKVLIEDLEEVSNETFIIVWARFRGEIELIYEKLTQEGYTCEKYYGGSDDTVIQRFKQKEFRILVASVLKGGEGLNLQISNLHYFYSNSYKSDSRLQAEDRSHRIGQTNKVTYKDLTCKNTIDEKIWDTLKRKEDMINYFRTRQVWDD